MLLSYLEPSGDPETLARAVEILISRAKMLNLPREPWSLCELGTDADDYLWLCQWASRLRADTIAVWICSQRPYLSNEWGVTRQAAFGLLFLLFAAEVARRDATERHLWTYICKDGGRRPRFTANVEALLFVQGQPTDELKQAIEKAARTFNLRNVFGISGLMNWLNSVFLQFGFTRRGFMARLPFWMAGEVSTHTIEALLAKNRGSSSFAFLWENLQEVRRGNIGLDTFMQRTQGSSWVLPEWRADLLVQARRRPELGTKASANGSADLPEAAHLFLAAPMLRWSASQPPVFVTHLQNLLDQGLEETDYTLVVGEQECATLIRQADDTYAVLPNGDIVLPTLAPTIVVSLVGPDGVTARTQTLTLFDPSDEVTAFRHPSGSRLPNVWTDPLDSRTDLLLLLSPDLTMTPEPSRWEFLPNKAARVCHLASGWDREVCVRLEGELFWKPVLAAGRETEEPAWTQAVQAKWERAAHVSANLPAMTPDSAMAWLRVDCPANSRIVWVRAGGAKLQSTPPSSTGQVFYGPLRLFDDSPRRKITLRIEHEENGEWDSAVVSRWLYTISAGVQGAVRQTPEGWVSMGSKTRMSVREALTQPIRLLPPSNWVNEDTRGEFGLIEGRAWIGSAARIARPLGRLGGWGAPLELRPRPYNTAGQSLPLAAEVYDSGSIADAVVLEAGDNKRVVRLHLYQRTEPDAQFQVLWWDVNGTLIIAGGDTITVSEDGSWECAVNGELSDPLVIALAYEGVRRGAWWREDWACQAEHLAAANPLQTAALLRYFKLPLCARKSRPFVIRLFRSSPGRTLEAWLTAGGLPKPFRQQQDADWNPTLRTLLSDWMPNERAAMQIRDFLRGDTRDWVDNLLIVADRLNAICPILMARVLQVFRDHVLPARNPNRDSRGTLRKVCRRLAELPLGATEIQMNLQKQKLIEAACEMLGMGVVNAVDSAFVSSRQGGLVEKAVDLFEGRPVSDPQKSNLDVAFATVEPLRRLVAITLLQRLIA